MDNNDIRTLGRAFVYLIECNLATLEDLLRKKNSSKSAIRRQAQLTLNSLWSLREGWMNPTWLTMSDGSCCTRVEDWVVGKYRHNLNELSGLGK